MGLSILLLFLLFGCCWYSTSSANRTGKVEKFGGLDSYITGPPESKLAVLMASDVYGYTVPHLRLIADKAGARGFLTLVPDFFGGDPYTNSTVEPVDQWKQRHPQDIGVEDAKFVIQALKQMGITKIGAVGFCWGGKVAVDLTKAPSVEVGVLLHPTETNVSDIQGVKVPIAILGGKHDTLTPPRLIKKFKATLKKTKPKVDNFVKIYPKCEAKQWKWVGPRTWRLIRWKPKNKKLGMKRRVQYLYLTRLLLVLGLQVPGHVGRFRSPNVTFDNL